MPTDFSDNALKALEYASYLAIEIGAKVLLLNAYQIPAGTSNLMINFSDIIEKDSKDALHDLIVKMTTQDAFKKVNYEGISCYGYLTEAMDITTKNRTIDLIVMGTTGASTVKNKLLGSNTVDVIKKTSIPLVVIPNEVEYKGWNHIILASNIDNNVQTAVAALSNIIDIENIEIDILAVENEVNAEAIDHTNLIKNLNGWHYQFRTEQNENIVDGIVEYSESHDSDLIVILKKSYSFIERIVHKSVTNKMALHTKKPLFLLKV